MEENMLNFVLCDDNLNSLDKFSKMLNLVFINNNLDAQITLASGDANETLNYIKNNVVDVAILDIDLHSEISGIELAQKIRAANKKIYIIFATAHLEYLLLAYKCKTFDYLPKPITLNNIESTILRLFADIKQNSFNKKYIKINNRDTVINADSIYYIEKNNTKVIFKTDTIDYCTYSSFNKIKDSLPSNFIRCHKSYIVNVNKIESIEKSTIHFDKTNTIKCYIGQIYKNRFWEEINK